MSELRSRFDIERRLSFFKTPIPRNSLQVIGHKRNYSQIASHAEDPDSSHTDKLNPNKKRRVLSTPEIENLCKRGGFNPSHILIAIEEPDGFRWFKRVKTGSSNSPQTKQKYLRKYADLNNSRNYAKDVQKQKVAQNQNPNEVNKQNAQKAMQKSTKARRHTVSVEVLNKLREQNDQKQRELMGTKKSHGEEHRKHKEKKGKKRRSKVKKKIVRYESQQQIVRKKVKKKKRVVYKKKTRSTTIKITTEFASVDIPDFPIPKLRLSTIYFSSLDRPFIAIQNFESSLIESLLVPLEEVYGQNSHLSFITQNVLQYLMQIKQHLSDIVNCIEFDVLNVPLQSAIRYHQQQQTLSPKKNETAQSEEDNNLKDELQFYQNQFLILDEFCQSVQAEMDFTKNVHSQLQDEEYLRSIFDFDLNANDDAEIEQHSGMKKHGNDNEFINAIACDMDDIYSAHQGDLTHVEMQQTVFDRQLNRRRLKQLELTNYYMKSGANQINEDENKQSESIQHPVQHLANHQSLVFSNFIHANKNNDNLEDDTVFAEGYLRRFDGYQFTENDTLDLGETTRC